MEGIQVMAASLERNYTYSGKGHHGYQEIGDCAEDALEISLGADRLPGSQH